MTTSESNNYFDGPQGNNTDENNELLNNLPVEITSIKDSKTEIKLSELIIQNKKKNKLYICEKCSSFPIIRKCGNKIKISCKCKDEEKEMKEYIKTEFKEKNDDIIQKYKYCKTHADKLIKKACINCKLDLCDDCVHDKNHTIKDFKELDKDIEYLKQNIEDYFNGYFKKEEQCSHSSNPNCFSGGCDSVKKKDEFSGDNSMLEKGLEDANILNELIPILISNIDDFPSYSHYENVKHICSIIGEKLELTYNINNPNNKDNKDNKDNKEPNLKIRLLGKEFVEKNKNNCSLIINGEIEELKEEYQLTDKDKDKIGVILLKEKDVTDMSYMFYGCENLTSISDNSKWKTDKVTDLSYMFNKCASLETLTKKLKNLDTSKVKDMTYMFDRCKNLIDLDVSKWKTNKVENMGYLFNGCKNLVYISGISKLDTSNVDNMCFLFADCSSLQELREIFNWNTSNVTDMSYMFYNCKALKFLTTGEKKYWDTQNVTNMSNMFNGCESIEAFPDNIFQWDTSKVQYMSYMFGYCESLISISEDIVKWNMENVLHMNSMFEGCKKLQKLPAGIIGWKIDKLVDINEMIEGCDALKDEELPDFSKWKGKKIVYKGGKKFAKFFK